jgi:release factor glutamine methyltransferase
LPRNDSEILIDTLLTLYRNSSTPLQILDIGTGSGCLIISALKHLPKAQGIALDIAANSLAVAKHNATGLNVAHRIKWIKSNMFEKLNNIQFDIILCNPPYIAKEETHLMNQDTTFEPKIALFAADSGLYFYREIAKQLAQFLKNDGHAIFEIGYNQKEAVAEIFQAANFTIEQIVHDLESRPRCIVVRKND